MDIALTQIVEQFQGQTEVDAGTFQEIRGIFYAACGWATIEWNEETEEYEDGTTNVDGREDALDEWWYNAFNGNAPEIVA